MRSAALLLTLTALLGACGQEEQAPQAGDQPPAGDLSLASHPLREGSWPVEHTCDGANTSPPVEWAEVPADAAELVLTLLDPDAPGGTFVHWVVYGIAAADGMVEAGAVPAGGVQGRNSFGDTAYGGPCPPEGEEHGYVLAIEAVSEPTGLGPGASYGDVTAAVSAAGSLARAELNASYGR